MQLTIFILLFSLLSCGVRSQKPLENQEEINSLVENALSELECFQSKRKLEVVLNANERLNDFLNVLDKNHPDYLLYVNAFSPSIMEHLIASKQTLQVQIDNLEIVECADIKKNEEVYICYNTLDQYKKRERKPYDLLIKPFIYLAQPIFTINNKLSLLLYNTGGDGYSQLSLAIYKRSQNGIWILETRAYLAI